VDAHALNHAQRPLQVGLVLGRERETRVEVEKRLRDRGRNNGGGRLSEESRKIDIPHHCVSMRAERAIELEKIRFLDRSEKVVPDGREATEEGSFAIRSFASVS
jgi:hypothetical protein